MYLRFPAARFCDRSPSQDLEAQLIPRTYIVGNYLTAADVALYGALHPVLVRMFILTLVIRRSH